MSDEREHEPIQDSAAKGSGGAGATEEEIPNGLSEGLRFTVAGEADSTGSTAETEGDDLARGLACLDVGGEGAAVG